MMRPLLLGAMSLAAMCAPALSVDFSSGIPADFTIENTDGADRKDGIYAHLGNDPQAAWLTGQLPDHDLAALSPTRHAGDAAACHRLTLPPVEEGCVLRWQARSLHYALPETYTVELRAEGSDAATLIYSCEGEHRVWTTRSVDLSRWAESRVEITFTATTASGFMLALDNLFVGVPDKPVWSFTPDVAHFARADEPLCIAGTLESHGSATPWTYAVMRSRSESGYTVSESVPLAPLAAGERQRVEFAVVPADGETVQYSIVACTDAGESAELYSDFYTGAPYERMSVLDHCTGTWCNNCPMMEPTTSRLADRYGRELFIVDAHVNDVLTDRAYWEQYLSEFCFAIPMLVPDRRSDRMVYSLAATDYMQAALSSPARAQVMASASMHGSEVRVVCTAEMADATDNSADRYRLAYMLTACVHEPENPFLIQQNSAATFHGDSYYYQPSAIRPEMMYFDNVPVETSTAMGVPMSLPSAIQPRSPMQHSISLPLPEAYRDGLTLLAMLIDTADGSIMNACAVPVDSGSGITDLAADPDRAPDFDYDLLGRPSNPSTPGLHITRRGVVWK